MARLKNANAESGTVFVTILIKELSTYMTLRLPKASQ